MGLLNAKASASAFQKPVVPPHAAPPPSSRTQAAPAPPPQRSPDNEPAPARAGLVRCEPGEPFVHYCMTCGAWGAFGIGVDILSGRTGRWFCRDHKPQV